MVRRRETSPAEATSAGINRVPHAGGRIAAAVALLVVGAAIGAWLRPVAGGWLRSRETARPPQPLDTQLAAAQHDQFTTLDPHVPHGAVVYLGDSITARMRLSEYLRCGDRPIVNRAIAGDTTVGVAARIVRSFPPEAAVCLIMVGYNDLKQGAPPAAVAARIRDFASQLLTQHGVRRVVIESVLPGPPALQPRIDAVNAALAIAAAGHERLSYLNLHPEFTGQGGRKEQLFVDHAHLSARGMIVRVNREVAHLRDVCPELPVRLIIPVEETP